MRYWTILPILLLLTILYYQETNPAKHPTDGGKSREDDKGEIKPLTPSPDTSHIEIGEPKKNPKQDNETNSDNGASHWINSVNTFFAAIITVFTILIFFVYLAMLRASKINERAWVVPVIGTIEPTKDPQQFQIKVDLKNNGKTPAWITAAGSRGKGATEQQPLPIKPLYDEMSPFTKKGTLLSPAGSFTQGFPLEKQRLDHVLAGQSRLFIFGYASYRDVYGDSHIIRYCFEAKKSQDVNHPHPLEFYVGGPNAYWEAD